MESPEPAAIAVELDAAGESVRLRWDPVPTGGAADEQPVSGWELESEPDWGHLEGVRLVSARFDDGSALGLAAVRPREAGGHGDDIVIARLLDADGTETTTSEALVSIEYDAAGRPRRLGIELWPEPESAPLRVAADRRADDDPPARAGRDGVAMEFRLDGTQGNGICEILRPD